MKFKLFFKKVARKIRGGIPTIEEYRMRGVEIGDNCHIYGFIDYGHDWLVSMGNNVTIAGGAKLLTHDGSTKKILGYSKVGCIVIGDDVFIGAAAIVLPNVKIGSKVIVGAGSVVTRDIPDNSVVVGSPAKVVGTYDEYVRKNKELFEVSPVQHTSYTQKTDEEKRQLKDALLKSGYGFDV